jgi:hypothetical protein
VDAVHEQPAKKGKVREIFARVSTHVQPKHSAGGPPLAPPTKPLD